MITLKILLKNKQGLHRIPKLSYGGRNFLGRICVHHRGSLGKRCSYLVDEFRRVNDLGTICKIVKGPQRSSYLGLLLYQNGLFSYVTLSENLHVGQKIYSGLPSAFSKNLDGLKAGFAVPLNLVNPFNLINNIESFAYSGFVLAKAAGLSALITSKLNNKIMLKLSSGWQVSIKNNSFGVLGTSSNSGHRFKNIIKAGKARALGKRPVVRGVAKNPCDHPHGGGEGKSSPPRVAVSPWGRFTKGTPSTNKKYQRLKRRLFKKTAK